MTAVRPRPSTFRIANPTSTLRWPPFRSRHCCTGCARNPLHSDPAFAAAAGFPASILRGLCTYGIVCRTLVDAVLGGDVARVGSFAARFAGIVFPEETLRVQTWHDEAGVLASASVPSRNNAPALSDVLLELV